STSEPAAALQLHRLRPMRMAAMHIVFVMGGMAGMGMRRAPAGEHVNESPPLAPRQDKTEEDDDRIGAEFQHAHSLAHGPRGRAEEHGGNADDRNGSESLRQRRER